MMKNIFLTTSFLFMIVGLVHSQSDDQKYREVMIKNIKLIYSADTIPSYQNSVNAFQRIAAAEPGRWEPRYYAAFGFVIMGTLSRNGDEKDIYLDQALAEIAKAREVQKLESEIDALEGFVYMIRVTADPSTRGPQMAPLAMKYFQTALSLNPDNPRAMALLAQMQYGTAKFFGSPLTEACETARASVERFLSYKNNNELAPTWGQAMAEALVQDCGN